MCYWKLEERQSFNKAAKNLAETCPRVLWKVELTSELGYLAEATCKPSIEDTD